MLVLTRKSGERIGIDEKITVTVLKIQGHQIRLGIEAPKEIPIKRKELIGSRVVAACGGVFLRAVVGVLSLAKTPRIAMYQKIARLSLIRRNASDVPRNRKTAVGREPKEKALALGPGLG